MGYCFNELWDSLDDELETIRIYLASETTLDPYEKNKSYTVSDIVPIKGIVTDLTATQISYKMPGIIADDAKQLIIRKKYRSLIESSYKIEIRNIMYFGWKVHGKAQIRQEGDFLRIYVYRRTSDNV